MNKLTKCLKYILILSILMGITPVYAASQGNVVISNYQPIFIAGRDTQGKLQVAIRSFKQGNIAYYLVVNPKTLVTRIIPMTAFKTNIALKQQIAATPYGKALHEFSLPPYKLQNYGLIRAQHPVNGMFLTVDMCPSKKPFEKHFFETLIRLSNKTHQPVPVALSMSGDWMKNHPQEFQWLIDQKDAGKLQITWVNHTLTHFYNPKLPLQENFLLSKGTHVFEEILGEEKILLAHRQTPSVFFRFPGLVSDQYTLLKVNELGLIPVGSNAWLAKGESSQSGSIILVHGNSNEPQGIKDILPMLESGKLYWLSLPSAIENGN